MKKRQKRCVDQVREVIRAKHYAIRTEEAYLSWIRKYIICCGFVECGDCFGMGRIFQASSIMLQHGLAQVVDGVILGYNIDLNSSAILVAFSPVNTR
ncbi:MAG: hypothetical protein JRJ42_08340 [Deltaproteobacteria bacterium]|nr:hypothetical protein [Deltaproteobacteria bacterium]MBW2019875.1 hypothetical protein [Deltaproteobacteria bacterium]MBW2074984.1 hypothetical protein [Deltaproteobacteria bacterium]RLB82443.1 MAG: hypothetical protein DRH17_05920 [Deltaproteobacteria bacterium]